MCYVRKHLIICFFKEEKRLKFLEVLKANFCCHTQFCLWISRRNAIAPAQNVLWTFYIIIFIIIICVCLFLICWGLNRGLHKCKPWALPINQFMNLRSSSSTIMRAKLFIMIILGLDDTLVKNFWHVLSIIDLTSIITFIFTCLGSTETNILLVMLIIISCYNIQRSGN